MSVSEDVKARIEELLGQAPRFQRVNEQGQITDRGLRAAAVGWNAAAHSIAQIACESSPRSAYLAQIDKLLARDYGFMIGHQVESIAAVLKQLLIDLERGLLTNMERRVSAETFDDL